MEWPRLALLFSLTISEKCRDPFHDGKARRRDYKRIFGVALEEEAVQAMMLRSNLP